MKSILLIGIGNLGKLIAREIDALGHEIMAVDRNEDRINTILPFVTSAQIGDSTNELFLKSLGVNNYDVCIVTIGEGFQSSLETVSLLKDLGAKWVVARADSEVQEKFLLRNGADDVINPERQIAQWTAIRFTSDHILDYIKLDEEHGIFEVAIPDSWLGKTVSEVDIRKKFGINILGFKKDGITSTAVGPDTVFAEDKTLLVLGEMKAIHKCFRT